MNKRVYRLIYISNKGIGFSDIESYNGYLKGKMYDINGTLSVNREQEKYSVEICKGKYTINNPFLDETREIEANFSIKDCSKRTKPLSSTDRLVPTTGRRAIQISSKPVTRKHYELRLGTMKTEFYIKDGIIEPSPFGEYGMPGVEYINITFKISE